MQHVLIVGASGAIGGALVRALSERVDVEKIYAASVSPCAFNDERITVCNMVDYTEHAVTLLAEQIPVLDTVIVATGILHYGQVMPEKSLKDVKAEQLAYVYHANAIFPTLVAKHMLSKFTPKKRCLMGCLSARVGSISDNGLGGWYAYRASKSALNMLIKNIAIEHGRFYPEHIVVGLHPGTVDSALSKPFYGNIPKEKLFTPDLAADQLLAVMSDLEPHDSGKCFAWDAKEIQP